jgi:hypothetical protein
MTNLDYWNTFVGEESPESFLRNYGTADPELCVSRFLEERGQFYGVVNQGSWVKTFSMPEQHHCLTVKVYLLSFLDETRDEWHPALEANPPSIPKRYREKFDQDRYPPPEAATEDSLAEEAGTYGTYIPESDHDFSDDDGHTTPMDLAPSPDTFGDSETDDESSVVTPSYSEIEEELAPELNDPPVDDVFVPESDVTTGDFDSPDTTNTP